MEIVLRMLIWMFIVGGAEDSEYRNRIYLFYKVFFFSSRRLLCCINRIVSKLWECQTWTASSVQQHSFSFELKQCTMTIFWCVHYYMNTKTLFWTRWAWWAGYSCQANMQMRDNSLPCYGLSLNFQSYCSFAAGVFA